jgi:transposase-like protein
MARKRFQAEQIIGKLREAEVELARGKKIPEACKQIGVTEQTFYRWRSKYGGMQVSEAKRLKELEAEIEKLKQQSNLPLRRRLPESAPCSATNWSTAPWGRRWAPR